MTSPNFSGVNISQNPSETILRLPDYLEHIGQAGVRALALVSSLTQDAFLEDQDKQELVTFQFIIIGEASAKLMEKYKNFTEDHPEVKWAYMRRMRNAATHDYFKTDYLDTWMTTQRFLPDMLKKISVIRQSMPKDDAPPTFALEASSKPLKM